MPMFRYRALDKDGNLVSGSVEEASARRVVLTLKDQGLSVNNVEQEGEKAGLFSRRTKLTWSDLELLNDQLHRITKSGLPLAPGLAALANDIDNPRVIPILDDIRRHIEAGHSLEDALKRHPGSFPPVYAALVRAGEQAGNLSAVFGNLHTYSRRMVELQGQAKAVLAYPITVALAAVGMILFMMLKIVPPMVAVFADFGGRLPLPTRIIAGASGMLSTHLPVVLAGLGIVVVFGAGLLLYPRNATVGCYGRDWLKEHVPLLGNAFSLISVARFCRVLGMLLQARIPVTESLTLAGAAAGNAVLSTAIGEASKRVSTGVSLSEALKSTGYFDNSFCWLIGNAEQRGELDQALLVMYDDYDRAIEMLRKWITTLAGPVAIVGVGVLVAFVIVSLYLPIFSLGDVISGT